MDYISPPSKCIAKMEHRSNVWELWDAALMRFYCAGMARELAKRGRGQEGDGVLGGRDGREVCDGPRGDEWAVRRGGNMAM